MMRLRRRLDGTGLAIRTVRSRGYLLEWSGSVQPHAREA
jgi:DNA-binding response OmpR family regulator